MYKLKANLERNIGEQSVASKGKEIKKKCFFLFLML